MLGNRAAIFLASAPVGNEARKNRKGDLVGPHRPEVQANWALNPRDHVLGDALGAQRFQVMAGVPAAADQPDEPRVSRYHRLERLHQVRIATTRAPTIRARLL